MNNDKLEFLCPYCKEFMLKTKFDIHKEYHKRNDGPGEKFPVTLEELEQRFVHLGYWEER